LSTSVLAEIEDREARVPAVAVTLPWKEPEGESITVRLLVTAEDRQAYSGGLFSKVVWQRAFRAAGIEYGSQRTACTRCGTSTPRCCRRGQCRSRSWRTTSATADPGFALRTYTHLLPSSHERVRVAVDGVFGRPEPVDDLRGA
jgi:hypothetical protein